MQIRYFAWVRQRIGISSEEVCLPDNVKTVSDVIAWLKSRGPEFQSAFADEAVIRAAIDQIHAPHDAALSGAREIAFFPPVTGG